MKCKTLIFKRGEKVRISSNPVMMYNIGVAGKTAKVTHSKRVKLVWDKDFKECVEPSSGIVHLDIDKRYGMPHTGIWAGNLKRVI